jgi:hypothetical protein
LQGETVHHAFPRRRLVRIFNPFPRKRAPGICGFSRSGLAWRGAPEPDMHSVERSGRAPRPGGRSSSRGASSAARFAPLFHEAEVIVVDPALTECCGNPRCPDPPRKPDPPRNWDGTDGLGRDGRLGPLGRHGPHQDQIPLPAEPGPPLRVSPDAPLAGTPANCISGTCAL